MRVGGTPRDVFAACDSRGLDWLALVREGAAHALVYDRTTPAGGGFITEKSWRVSMATAFNPEPGVIRWRVHLKAAPERVYALISTDDGRSRFWVEKTVEKGDVIHWTFKPGVGASMKVFEKSPPRKFAFEFFDDSRVTFDVEPDGKGGTDLTMTNSNLPEKDIPDMTPGWVGILMNLKAVVDHSIDLRNLDSARSGEQGFVEP